MRQGAKTRILPRQTTRQSERNDFFTAVGIPSLITVLVVMLLGSFAVLSLITARADIKLAKKAYDAASDYYAADLAATQKLAELKRLVKEGADISSYGFDVIQTIDSGELICYNIPIDNNNSLKIELSYANGELTVKKWQTTAAQTD